MTTLDAVMLWHDALTRAVWALTSGHSRILWRPSGDHLVRLHIDDDDHVPTPADSVPDALWEMTAAAVSYRWAIVWRREMIASMPVITIGCIRAGSELGATWLHDSERWRLADIMGATDLWELDSLITWPPADRSEAAAVTRWMRES